MPKRRDDNRAHKADGSGIDGKSRVKSTWLGEYLNAIDYNAFGLKLCNTITFSVLRNGERKRLRIFYKSCWQFVPLPLTC